MGIAEISSLSNAQMTRITSSGWLHQTCGIHQRRSHLKLIVERMFRLIWIFHCVAKILASYLLEDYKHAVMHGKQLCMGP